MASNVGTADSISMRPVSAVAMVRLSVRAQPGPRATRPFLAIRSAAGVAFGEALLPWSADRGEEGSKSTVPSTAYWTATAGQTICLLGIFYSMFRRPEVLHAEGSPRPDRG